MKDIVIVPTYDRPEYLSLCLENLLAAEGIEDKQIWVVKDYHSDIEQSPELFDQFSHVIVNAFYGVPADRFRSIWRKPHTSYGNSLNVLAALSEAYYTGARRIYLVEDDVLVMPDFFQWHEAAQEQFHPFVSCAGRINRSLNFERNGREAIDESCRDPLACSRSGKAYLSWATCFQKDSLGTVLANVDPETWYDTAAPGNEQDILIQNILRSIPSGLGCSVWPYVPRAYHMGMHSYHRNAGLKFNGTLNEKIKALRATISDPYKIRLMALLQDDIDPYPTQPMAAWSGPLYLKSDYREKR